MESERTWTPVVSSVRDHVYDDCNEGRPATCGAARKSARYHGSPSLLFSSIVPKLRFGRGRPAAKNGRPSAPVVGVGMLTSELRYRCRPRDPAYPTVAMNWPGSARWTLTFQTCGHGTLHPTASAGSCCRRALERRVQERRVRDHESRRRRRIGDRHDQVLLHRAAEVEAVAAANGRRGVAEHVPARPARGERFTRPGPSCAVRSSAPGRRDSPSPRSRPSVSIGIVVAS